MEEIKENNRCPECGRHSELINFRHLKNCSLIDLDSAKFYLKFVHEQQKRYLDRISRFAKEAQKWEGKYRIVKHENNQLRKKLK